MSKHCVVVGAGIGGLSAAIHARLHGWNVTVLEQHPSSGGKARQIETQGYRFDPGPSIVILTHLYDEVFRRTGKEPGAYLKFKRLDPWTRVYFADQPPIDLPADYNECLEVICGIAPEDFDSIKKLLVNLELAAPLAEQGIFQKPVQNPLQMIQPSLAKFARLLPVRKPYKQVVDEFIKSPLLRAFFYGFPSYGGQSYRTASPGSFLIPFYMMRHGVYWPVGGIGAIPNAFESLARDLGVEFRFNQKVKGVELSGSRITAVRTEQDEAVPCDAVISNQDRFTFGSLIGRDSKERPSFSYFTVSMGIRRKMSKLSHHTLLIPEQFEPGFEQLYSERTFPKNPILYLNETSSVDPSVAPKGGSNVFAVVTSPACEDHLEWASLESDAAERVLSQLQRFDIDFDPSSVEVMRVQTPQTFAQRDGNYRGSLYGLSEEHRLWGFMPHRCSDEKIANLYYAGGSVQPGAGMPMVTLSGKFAADLMQSRS